MGQGESRGSGSSYGASIMESGNPMGEVQPREEHDMTCMFCCLSNFSGCCVENGFEDGKKVSGEIIAVKK